MLNFGSGGRGCDYFIVLTTTMILIGVASCILICVANVLYLIDGIDYFGSSIEGVMKFISLILNMMIAVLIVLGLWDCSLVVIYVRAICHWSGNGILMMYLAIQTYALGGIESDDDNLTRLVIATCWCLFVSGVLFFVIGLVGGEALRDKKLGNSPSPGAGGGMDGGQLMAMGAGV